MGAIRTCLIEKYCVFSGRAPRSEYCIFLAACIVLTGLFKAFGAAVLFLPLAAVTVRRLHDCGVSGYVLPAALLAWLLLARIPLLGPLSGWALMVTASVLMFVKGTDGPNAYGEDPLPAAHRAPSPAPEQQGHGKAPAGGFLRRCRSRLHALLHGRPSCPNCSAYVAPGDRFCKTCGFDLEAKAGKACPGCGAPLEDEGFYCPKCGSRVR